jgi:inosine-uridine nucleoside N-ribohydrolase
MQFQGQAPSLGIILDCGLGNSIEEALALALLYGLDGKNEMRILALSVSKPNLKAAAFLEAISRFYGGVASGAFGVMGRTLPVGLADAGKLPEDTPMLTTPLARRTEDGKPLYPHGIENLNDTAESRTVLRNAIFAQADQSCVVILTGPATNLARLLDLPGVKEVIAQKVRFLVVAGGVYQNGEALSTLQADNFKIDAQAAKKLFAEWPTPIVAAGDDVGSSILYPAASIEKDFAWTPAHPIVDAYRAYKSMPYDATTAAMAAVLYAVRSTANDFKLSVPGTIRVADDGHAQFIASPEGKHRYLMVESAQKEALLKTFIELASAKPVPKQPRQRRPPPQQVEPPKATTPKPPAQF